MKIMTLILSAIILNACGGSKESIVSEASKEQSKEFSEIESKKTELDKKQDANYNIEYSAMTRGSSLLVAAKNGMLTLNRNGETKPGAMQISSKQTLALLSNLSKINVEKLSELKAPSTASHYDGAMAATLKIIKNGETYQTPTFDHGNPPKEIKDLVDYLLSLSKVE